MGYSNETVCVNFLEQTGKRKNGNTGYYEGDTLWSYSTAIAKLIDDRYPNTLLVWNESFSSTTGKLRSTLLWKARQQGINIVYVPIVANVYGGGYRADRYFPNHGKIMENFYAEFQYNSCYLYDSKHRKNYAWLQDQLNEYVNWYNQNYGCLEPRDKNLYKQILELGDKLVDLDFINDIKKQHRQNKDKKFELLPVYGFQKSY